MVHLRYCLRARTKRRRARCGAAPPMRAAWRCHATWRSCQVRSACTARCVCTAQCGALSDAVCVCAVVEVGWEAAAQAGAAAAGGVAAVTCGATRDADAALVRVALWYRGDAVLHIDPPSPGNIRYNCTTFCCTLEI